MSGQQWKIINNYLFKFKTFITRVTTLSIFPRQLQRNKVGERKFKQCSTLCQQCKIDFKNSISCDNVEITNCYQHMLDGIISQLHCWVAFNDFWGNFLWRNRKQHIMSGAKQLAGRGLNVYMCFILLLLFEFFPFGFGKSPPGTSCGASFSTGKPFATIRRTSPGKHYDASVIWELTVDLASWWQFFIFCMPDSESPGLRCPSQIIDRIPFATAI